MPTKAPFKFMSEDEIKRAVKRGDDQCIVIAENSGTLCWDITDPENEKTYQIEKGDLLWCWNFIDWMRQRPRRSGPVFRQIRIGTGLPPLICRLNSSICASLFRS